MNQTRETLRPEKHGHAYRARESRTYKAWTNMRSRCLNQKGSDYHYYGGRGITVCERWRSFNAFLGDMGIVPDGMTLERLDNEGNYEPGNCCWASRAKQRRNTRSINTITFRGETLCVTDWSRRLGLSHRAVWVRIHKLGWSIEKALTTKSLHINYHPRAALAGSQS